MRALVAIFCFCFLFEGDIYAQTGGAWVPYGDRYAIVVMGGNEGYNTNLYGWYWGDTYGTVTQLKTKYGFIDSNICFLAYGPSAASHASEVNDTSTIANIQTAYSWAAQKCGPDDLLYIYWIDHGIPTAFKVHDGLLSLSQLGLWTDSITAKCIIGVYNPCYSGAVIDDVSRAGVISITSVDEYQVNGFGWAGAWRTGLNGGDVISPSDINADGHISMTEMYQWIAPLSQAAGETSSFDDNGDGVYTQLGEQGFAPTQIGSDGYYGTHYAVDAWYDTFQGLKEEDLKAQDGPFILKIYNLQGQLIKNEKVDKYKEGQYREGLTKKGIYIISYESQKGSLIRKSVFFANDL